MFGIEFLMEDIAHTRCFVGAGHQEHVILRREQRAGQQGNTPLAHLLHVDRAGDVLAVLDRRFTGKEAGGVGIRSHAALHYVEMRQLSLPAHAADERVALLCSPDARAYRAFLACPALIQAGLWGPASLLFVLSP